MAKIGPKEAELRRKRKERMKNSPRGILVSGFDDIITESPPCAGYSKPMKETSAVKKKTVKTTSKKKTVTKPKSAKKKTVTAKKGARKVTSAQAVADFICQPGGASMAELETKFGIDAHPMRAKIYYIRNTLNVAIESKEGRYYGPPAKG